MKKNHLRCWGCLSLLIWIRAVILTLLLKLPPKKLEPWLILWRFHLRNRCVRLFGLSLAASPEPLSYRRIVAILSLLYRYYFGRYSSELVKLFTILIGGMIFLSLFIDVIRMSISTVSPFPQLESAVLYLLNASVWPTIYMALSLELIDTFLFSGSFWTAFL